MKVTHLTPNRTLLEFDSLKEMNLTLYRITEFSEGLAGLRSTYSTPDIFLDLYSNKNGLLDYFGYWDGHNISKLTVRQFINTYHDQLTNREKNVIEAIKDLKDTGYLIAMKKGDKITLKHEMAHGLYFDTPLYKERADAILGTISKSIYNQLKKGLKKINYHDDVIQDEIQAYLTAYDKIEFKELFPSIPVSKVRKQIKELNDNYKSFS